MGMLDRFRRTTPEPLGEPLAAAAVRVLEPSRMANTMLQSREVGEAWQAYRCLGEVRYVTNQQARLVGRLDWTLTIGGGEPMDTDKSNELLRAAFGDGLEDLATRAALNMQVPGGYVLARTRAGDRDSWRVFSSPLSAKNKKRVEGSDVVIQVRTEDPEDEDRNDSPVLGAMDTCRELILARAQSRAQSRNRTAQQGLFVYAAEGVKDQRSFEENLQEVITAPLSDERTTASVTPNIMAFPAEFIDKGLKKIDLSGDYDEKLDAKIDRLVRSLGVQLDVPPELLLGFGDSNHWSAWAIQEDNWLGHVEPMAKPIGAGFAAAIMEASGATEVKVEPDPGPLMQRRPATSDALAAQAAGLVNDEWTREQLGADETDAPVVAEQDPAVVQAFKMVTAAPSLAQMPGLDVLVAQIRAVMSGTAVPSAPTPMAEAPAAAEPAAIAAALRDRLPVAAAVKGPDPRALQAIDVQAYDAVEDLVNDTADRVLERLGAKARSFASKNSMPIKPEDTNAQLAVAFASVIPNSDVAISETIAAAIPKLDRVVTRAFSRLRSAGVESELDPDDAETARSLFSVLVADVVATRLDSRPTTADAWQAARRVVAVAGGNGDIAPAVAS